MVVAAFDESHSVVLLILNYHGSDNADGCADDEGQSIPKQRTAEKLIVPVQILDHSRAFLRADTPAAADPQAGTVS